MSAYVVFTREHTTDATELQRYAQEAPAAREGHDVTRLAFYGQLEVLEGPSIEGAVISTFRRYDSRSSLVCQPGLPGGAKASSLRCGVPSFPNRRHGHIT